MASSHLFRLEPINASKGKKCVLVALQHNKRTLHNERGYLANIDATRSTLNYTLAGLDTPENININAQVLMLKAGIDTPRKNQVMAIEAIFSLPINRHQQDTRPFFTDCYGWICQNIAGELLSFDIHLDESAPHAHALILPLVDGKMQGSLILGGKGNIRRLQNKFLNDVASRYGLSKSDKKRLTEQDKRTIERLVLKRLQNDPIMQSCVWPIERDNIRKDPLPYADLLEIDLPPAKTNKERSFVQIMTSKGKGKH